MQNIIKISFLIFFCFSTSLISQVANDTEAERDELKQGGGSLVNDTVSVDPEKKIIEDTFLAIESALNQNNPALAIHLIKQVKKIGGEKYKGYYSSIGWIFYYLDKYDAAEESFKKALIRDSDNVDAQDGLAFVYITLLGKNGGLSKMSGRTKEDAIKIKIIHQEYVLLDVYFKVKRLNRSTDYTAQLDIWECETDDGKSVTYYFDYSTLIHGVLGQ